MATFEVQVEGLTSLAIDGSSSPTQDELTQFLTDGAKEIINNLPGHLLPLCASSNTFTSGSADTLVTGKILNVFRSDGDINQPCRKISSKQKGRVSDPEEMSYATITDPVFFIDNNSLDVLPSGGSCSYSAVAYPSVAYGASAITAFPNEAEHLVVLYGAVKSLQNVLGDKSSNSDITTALTAINTELDKIVTDVHVPVAPALSSNSLSFSTSAPVYTAPTVAGATEELTAALTHDSDADANKLDFSDWFEVVGDMIQTNEDTELASSQLQKISTYLTAYSHAMQNKLNEFNDANAEYQAQLQVSIQNAKLSESGDSQSLQKYSNEIQSYQAQVSKLVQSAQGYANEVQSRLQVDTAQYAWYEKQQAKLQSDYDKGLQALS